MKRWAVVCTVAVCVLWLGVAAPGLAATQPARGGTLIIATPGDPSNLNPALTGSTYAHFAGCQMFNSLVGHTLDLEPVPELAEAWEISEDGTVYTFHLVRNASWHDGVPFTSSDVKFSFEEVLIPHSPRGASNFSAIQRIETPDDYTVVFKLAHPFPPLLTLLGARYAAINPKHLYEGTDIRNNPHNMENPIGTGPFMFVEYERGDHLTMERNPNYFMPGKPYLDRVILKIIPDGATRVFALERGEVDYIPCYVPLHEVERLEANPEVVVAYRGVNAGRTSLYMMLFNLRDDVVSNVRVRQAIAYALDVDAITEKSTFGIDMPARGPFSQEIPWAFNPNVPSYPQDLSLANDLLDEAGYPRTGSGERFSLVISLGRGLPEEDRTAEIIREQLKAVGVSVELKAMDHAAFMDTVYNRWDFQVALRAHVTGPDPRSAAGATYHSENIRPISYGNAMGYSNAEVDRLLDEAAKAPSQEEARELLFEVQMLIAQEVPTYWIRERTYVHAWRANVRGLPRDPFGGATSPLHYVYFEASSS